MFRTYVLYSKKFDKIYVGYSQHAYQRLVALNDPRNREWPKSFQPWELLHIEVFKTKTEALIREKQLISTRGRLYIRNDLLKS